MLSSSTLVPDLIGDPVKEWIQAIYEDPGFFSFRLQGKRHWIHKYIGSPITNVGDKLAGMTEGETRIASFDNYEIPRFARW